MSILSALIIFYGKVLKIIKMIMIFLFARLITTKLADHPNCERYASRRTFRPWCAYLKPSFGLEPHLKRPISVRLAFQ